MNPEIELNEIYEAIGDNSLECTDEVLNRIQQLEDLINPPIVEQVPEPKQRFCSPSCNGIECWDCAAIRGGDPMDA